MKSYYSQHCLPWDFRAHSCKRQYTFIHSFALSHALCPRFTPIIICRFTLDLRQVKSPGSSWISGSQSASLRFVGNAGGSLHFVGDDDEEGEEDAVEQPNQAEESGVPIEDKEEDKCMISNGEHSPAQSVSAQVMSKKVRCER